MGQSLAIIAMSNFPLECLDPYVQFLCSSYLDQLTTRHWAWGGIPAHTLWDTLRDTPRDTLGPSDLTFWETVRKQGQRQGAKSDLRYWRTVHRRRALRPSFHYTRSTVSRLAWTGHLWCNMTLWAPKGCLACVSFVRRLIFETSVSPQSPDAMSNTRCSGGLLLHNQPPPNIMTLKMLLSSSS